MEGNEKRIRMKPVSEAMRAWAEALRREVEAWTGVTLKSAFGMTMVYRQGVVFAALPRTRALYEDDAILLKFNREPRDLGARIAAEARFATGTMEQPHGSKNKGRGEGHRWRIFVMRDDADVHAAIEWLAEAYRLAVPKGRKTAA